MNFLKTIGQKITEETEKRIFSHYPLTKLISIKINPNILEIISQIKARHMLEKAYETVPAYQNFIKKKKINIKSIKSKKDFDELIPFTTKENYIKKYSYEKRCIKEKFPEHGNIDESAGSSGTPTNWIRSYKEESLLLKNIKFEYEFLLKDKKKETIILSAWSSGPWATGIKFCELFEQFALVKNTSTNNKSIINTIKQFGKKYRYIIAGYPPFIKNLLDQEKLNWKEYDIDMITGGEGVTLEWRDYIYSKIKKSAKIFSAYGASDLDIGIGTETDITIKIRKELQRNKKFREKILGKDKNIIPMVFQYNPLMHYIENIKTKDNKQEFHITLLDNNIISPKIKYNIHDKGFKKKFREIEKIIYENPSLSKYFNSNKGSILKLPFLFINGRTDGTISLDGANIFPQEIEICIHRNVTTRSNYNHFKIQKKYDKKEDVLFIINIELKKGIKKSKALEKLYKETILKNLKELNPDYKESYEMNPTLEPIIKLYSFEKEVFEPKTEIKYKYILE